DEVAQAGQRKELAEQTQAAGTLEVEDQEQGQDEEALEAFPGGTAQEGNELGIEAVGGLLAEPVAQGGAGNALLRRVLSVRAAVGVAEVVHGPGGVRATPAAGICPGERGVGSLRGSHG